MTLIQTSKISIAASLSSSSAASVRTQMPLAAASGGAESELGLWIAALICFLNWDFDESESENLKNVRANLKNKIAVVGWGLLKCSQTAVELQPSAQIEAAAIAELRQIFRETTSLCEALFLQSEISSTAEKAWRKFIERELRNNSTIQMLARDRSRENVALPSAALEFIHTHNELRDDAGADVSSLFTGFFRLTELLQRVEKLLRRDSPLKPALLLFALIERQARDLLLEAQQTLEILQPETSIYEVLDGLLYVIPMELRKVYEFELIGVVSVRQSPMLFAHVENSCGLLIDCFQQAIIALAQVFEPDIKAAIIFRSQQIKLEQSLKLRRDLWQTLKSVKHAEKNLDPFLLKNLILQLNEFRGDSMRFLMFKDWDTTERFIEEISRTRRTEETAQVLHRFGAYLETLFNQVNMRNILANEKFEFPETKAETQTS